MDTDHAEVQVGEEDMWGNPVWGLPVPICISQADEFDKVWAPMCKGDKEAQGGCEGIVSFDEGRGVAELKLVELGTVHSEEFNEAAACVGEISAEDR